MSDSMQTFWRRIFSFPCVASTALLCLCGAAASQDGALGAWQTSAGEVVTWESPGAGGFDLSYGGTRDALSLSMGAATGQAMPIITVYSGEANASEWVRPLSVLPSGQGLYAPFSQFVPISGNGADFTHVTRVVVDPSVPSASDDFEMRLKAATTLTATLTVALEDPVPDSEFNPGETVVYTCVVTNAGADDTFDVSLSIFPDVSLQIEPGSAQTDVGAVTFGNAPGDTYVHVDAPFLGVPPCVINTITITFRARIPYPYDANTYSLCTGGTLISDNSPLSSTDDPATAMLNDATCFTVNIPETPDTCRKVILSDGFENGMGSFALYDLDGATPRPATSFVNAAWVQAAEDTNTNNSVAASTSYYNPAATADDWLVTQAIFVSGDTRLRWYARNVDTNFREGYEVLVSTTDVAVASFVDPPVFSVAEEQADWTLHTVDLAAAGYAYQTIYLAWHNNSTNKYLLYLDAIEVCDISPLDAPACPAPSLYSQPPNPLPGGYDNGWTSTAVLRLDSFTASEPVSRVTWWGIEYNNNTGYPCRRSQSSFRVAIYENHVGDVGTELYSDSLTVEPVETGRSIDLFLGSLFYPEFEYTIELPSPVSVPSGGWLEIQAPEDGSCYFGWLKSPTGDGTSLNTEPTHTSINTEAYDFAFCVSGPTPVEGEGEGTPDGVLEGTPDGTPDGIVEGTPDGVIEGTPDGVVEGTPDGIVEGTPDGVVEGTPDGIIEGTPDGIIEGTPDGVVEGEGEGAAGIYSADIDDDHKLDLSEVIRVIQYFNANGLHCAIPASSTEDGYDTGAGNQACSPHDADYSPANWAINLSELLRVVQFYSLNGYTHCPGTSEDGFCPGP